MAFLEYPPKKEVVVTPGEFLQLQLIDSSFSKYWVVISGIPKLEPSKKENNLYLFEIDTSSLLPHNNYCCLIWGSKENTDMPTIEDTWHIGEFYIATR